MVYMALSHLLLGIEKPQRIVPWGKPFYYETDRFN